MATTNNDDTTCTSVSVQRRLPRPKQKKKHRIDISGIIAIAPPESSSKPVFSPSYNGRPQEIQRLTQSSIESDTGKPPCRVLTTDDLHPKDQTDLSSGISAVPEPPCNHSLHYCDEPLAPPKILYENADIDDLKTEIMEELERIVIRAEERNFMNDLDAIILKQEQEEVMKTLLKYQVHVSEDTEFAQSIPSHVQHLTRIQDSTETGSSSRDGLKTDPELKRIWEAKRRRKRRRQEEAEFCNEAHEPGASKLIGEPEITELMTFRRELPIFIPRRHQYDNKCHLFTRSKYLKEFFSTPAFSLSEFRNDPNFNITLSEHHPDFPGAYQLEATGTKAQLEKVRLFTERFVQTVIADYNVAQLWNDERSLLLDVSISCLERLGVTANKYTFRNGKNAKISVPGVWIHEIERDGALCKALGGERICESGCMIVAVDGKHVFLPEHIQNNFAEARKSSSTNVTVSICLSKYTDLKPISSWLIGILKRRDGKSFNPEHYEKYRRSKEDGLIAPEATDDVFYEKRTKTKQSPIAETVKERDSTPSTGYMEQDSGAGHARYKMFVQKYRSLVRIEFRNIKNRSNKLLSSMWNAHKVMFGEDSWCDEQCACFQATSNMVEAAVMNNPGSSSTGLMNFFLPRFLDRLKEEYPEESIADLFRRVLRMWSEHQNSRRYGRHCGEDCQCGQEWNRLFGRGDKARSETFKAVSRKKARRSSTGASLSPGQPSKKRRFEQGSSEKKKSQRVKGRSKPPRPINCAKNSFETTFDSSNPIGGYFVTESGVDGVVGCHLFSKFEYGPIANDKRIRLGSTVIAAVVGDKRFGIHSHNELRQFYEHAKRGSRRLHLIFKNKGGLHEVLDDPTNWSISGNWTGQRKDGWPGGAKDPSEGRRPFDEKMTNVTPAAGLSLLHESSAESHHKGDSLSNAARNLSCKELIQVLENWYPQDATDVETHLMPQYQFVRGELKFLEDLLASGEDNDSSLIHRIQDWRAKYIALKVCMGNIFEIEKAVSLRAWNTIDFRLENLKLEIDKSSLFVGNKVINVSIQTKNPDLVLGSLPKRNFTDVIHYGAETETFRVHNNYLFTSESRVLVITVAAQEETEGSPSTMLGSFAILLDEAEKIFFSNDNWLSYTKSVPGLGSVEISAKRHRADKPYIMQKKEESIRGLKKKIETIEMFNKDINLPTSAKLSANVRGIGGISLLHAAIELVETTRLIEQLLHLKADPQASSTMGTPMEVANRLIKRSEKKLEEAQRNGKPKEVIEAHRERCLQAWKIWELLEKKHSENLQEIAKCSPKPKESNACTRRVSFAT
ncbi:hypothetical protein IV203_012293 [Nitzschia inconspicua]|uniref:Uncharacterized protein n=1 Tax=Nitzschia inconspicua TaxID=303405 RepID=A0A9K3KUE8_9STRA|nr:hypothetical protein IV203_012293 [Nitzschia inconspicua]